MASFSAAALCLLASSTGGSILFCFHHAIMDAFPPLTEFRSLWHPHPVHINSDSNFFSLSSNSLYASSPSSMTISSIIFASSFPLLLKMLAKVPDWSYPIFDLHLNPDTLLASSVSLKALHLSFLLHNDHYVCHEVF